MSQIYALVLGLANNAEQQLELLFKERGKSEKEGTIEYGADYVPVSAIGLQRFCKSDDKAVQASKEGVKKEFDCSKLASAMDLPDLSQGLWMAFSKTTDDKVVEAAKKAFEELVKNGEYDRVMGPSLKIKALAQ